MDRRTKLDPSKLGELPELDEQAIADKEAENGLLQFDYMAELISKALRDGDPPLTPDVIREFQRLAVDGLEPEPGVFRQEPVLIGGTSHVPPAFELVPELIDEMCAHVSDHWMDREPLHLASYVMWRLNWIHPFTNGNGRSSRAASYLVLCAALKMNLPGDRTVPEIIDEDKTVYYEALDEADTAWAEGWLDLSLMEKVIHDALVQQLEDAVR